MKVDVENVGSISGNKAISSLAERVSETLPGRRNTFCQPPDPLAAAANGKTIEMKKPYIVVINSVSGGGKTAQRGAVVVGTSSNRLS